MFWIQASAPRSSDRSGADAEDLTAAIEEIFPHDAEDAVLVWNKIPVLLNYKYDVSVIVADVLHMLEALMNSRDGSHVVGWASSSFRGVWRLTWHADTLSIDAQWDVISGNYAHLLGASGAITLPVDEFVSEWKMVLATVSKAIARSGITLADASELRQLRELESSISVPGRLYRPN